MGTLKAGKWTYSEEELEQMFDEADRRGKESLKTEIQARAASYDCKANRLIIELKNGSTFIVPCDLIQGLRGADPKEIAAVELGPRDASLHWEKLDQDFTVGGLMHGIFGTKAWMAELGRAGGRSKSDAKASAARENGKKGGRPRKKSRTEEPAASRRKRNVA
ncbi:MAG: DUF2442 domain-containing protein [Acidobacteria bacterium]|nr:DUF2442 domain-containing protein [Acidobacteriota bacterium]